MASLGTPPGLIRFGPFALDPANRELRMRGFLVRLQPQQFAVLLLLVDRAGQIVSREEIHQHIWGNDTFVDFERGINFSINQIRGALGDDADKPRYIETIPRRGYRFIGSVEKPVEEPPPANGVNAPSRRRNALWIGISVAAAVVLVAAIASWRTLRKTEQPSLPSIEVVPLVALQRPHGSPAFSPDGNQVAFDGYGGGDGAIYTALVGGDKPLRLTVKPGVCCPAWSPDNRQIAFLRFSKEGPSINVISALGGTEKTLYTMKIAAYRSICGRLDWSPDGKWLAFGESREKWAYTSITLLSLDDLTVRPLTFPSNQEYDCDAAFSPDGQRLAFTRGSVGGIGKDVFVIPRTGGEPRRLTFDNAWGGDPAWTQDGSDIVYSSARGGPLTLWRISATGGSPRPVAGVSALASHPSIPRKGNVLAYEHPVVNNNIWQIKLKNKDQPLGHPSRLIAARGIVNYRPNVSPDGQKIVFESDRLGYSDIWYCDRDGANCTQLTSLHGVAGTARWSPDGQHIVFEFQSRHYYDIYVMDLPGGRPRRVSTFPESDNGAPNWSRDGKWIYFYTTHEKGPLQLWKVPFQGGTPVQVTRNGGVYATESDDGSSLYFSKLEQSGIWKMPLNGGKEERVVDQPFGVHWFNWALSPAGLYFIKHMDGEKRAIEFFDFATRKTTTIGDVDQSIFGLALASDGKSLLYSQNESEDYDIMLVKNFH